MECNTSSIKTSFHKIRLTENSNKFYLTYQVHKTRIDLTENSNKFYLTYQVHKTRIDLSEIFQNPGNTSPDLS